MDGADACGPGALVVWDFDGTIADTFPAIASAADAALVMHGLGPADRDRLRAAVGLSLPAVFARLFDTEPDPRLLQELVAAYRAEFAVAGPRHTRLFPGVGPLLAELAGDGVVCAIATSKSRAGVEALLGHLGIAGHFATVVTDDDVAGKKPSPDMVQRACAEQGCRPAGALVIGDTEFDIRMGQAAGAATVGVTWGNKPRSVLAAAGPTWLVDDVEELAGLLRAWGRRRTG